MTRSTILALVLMSCMLGAQTIHDVVVPCCEFLDSVTNTNTTNVTEGTTVRWTLQGNQSHTITNGLSPSAPGSGALFNMTLNQQNSVRTHTFSTAGTFPYFCNPHFGNGMTGVVFVTPAASVTSVGSGCAGSNGQTLTLAATGLPTLGNAAFSLQVSGGLANGAGVLYGALGSSTPGLPVTPTCNLFLEINSFLLLIQLGASPVGPFPFSSTGTATIPFPVPSLQSWAGGRLDLQMGAVDAAAPGGFTVSNALTLRFGG